MFYYSSSAWLSLEGLFNSFFNILYLLFSLVRSSMRVPCQLYIEVKYLLFFFEGRIHRHLNLGPRRFDSAFEEEVRI